MRPYPLLHRFTSLSLALLVLAASIGLPVQRRTCRLSGRSTARIAWGVAGPSKANSGSATLAGHCYAYSLELHQLSTLAPEAGATKLLPAAPGPLALLPSADEFGLRASSPGALTSRAAPLAFPTPPPLPGGRALLARIGVLVV
ncbi:hypothetical protein [uncultured Hymenobacter sp.]|uniref:hypothetical protein n=1 Tax=uncultured Hymenobacter sp. TaxID=170016 RepID=UPI0035C9FEE8